MKINKFFMGLFGALAVAACSVDGPVDNGKDSPDVNVADSYVSVSIEMPVSTGTRADDDFQGAGNFQNGTADESNVSNIVFFFFDDSDICIDIQKIDNPTFNKKGELSENPYIESVGTVELRLKSGFKYDRVAAVLNSTVNDANSLKNAVKNVDDFMVRSTDYAASIKSNGSMQMMSNSVYYDTASSSENPKGTEEDPEKNKICLVPITSDNIYTSADDIDDLIAKGEKKYVEIYVERAAARIDVTKAEFNMENYYISKDADTDVKKKTITLYDYETGKETEITVRPVIKGMCLNVLSSKAGLVKPINVDEVGYGVGDGDYKNFKWNDPQNKRSYWATTAFDSEGTKRYFSWNQAVTQGPDAFTQYINPNTQDFATEAAAGNEGSSLNTKVMVVAELRKYESDDDKEGTIIDFVRYGGDYMMTESVLAHAANLINVAVRNIDWENAGLTLNDKPLDETQLNEVKTAVNNAFVTGFDSKSFEIGMLNPAADNKPGKADWEAKISKKSDAKYTLEGLSDELKTIAEKKVDEIIGSTLRDINVPAIYYWKDGKTYFYHNIRHQGFTGLTGQSNADDATDFLYGVVRNHIYKISLDGIYGLGTPVIEPGRPIDPDRPKNERPSFIKARINVLPWRVVTNSATIH